MNYTISGGPAFSTNRLNVNGEVVPDEDGMTLRDWFAGKALQGILAGTLTPEGIWSQNEVAETAYNVADAMLKARNT